jgi:integrase
VPHSVIASQANAYLRAHAAELFAEARTRVEAWESVRKITKPNTRPSGPTQSKGNSAMSHAAPTTANRTLPLRRPNAAYRQREYLTEAEVEKLIDAARKRSRSPERDAAAILLAYRHGLRAAELCALR